MRVTTETKYLDTLSDTPTTTYSLVDLSFEEYYSIVDALMARSDNYMNEYTIKRMLQLLDTDILT